MNEIYRHRTLNEYTIEELKTPYLWFSKPTSFNDTNDANLSAFMNDTKAIRNLFSVMKFDESILDSLCGNIDNLGICCFSTRLPNEHIIKKFPGGKSHKSICSVFKKAKLREYIEHTFLTYPVYRRVKYKKEPTHLPSDEYTIEQFRTNEYAFYENIHNIAKDLKKFDQFIYRILTTLSSKFSRQKEQRVILFRNQLLNFPAVKEFENGYQVPIPKDVISHIVYYNNGTLEELKSIGIETRYKLLSYSCRK